MSGACFGGVYIGGIDGGFWVGFRQSRVGLEVGNPLILDLEMLTFFWRVLCVQR
jgi:hypothetical protein